MNGTLVLLDLENLWISTRNLLGRELDVLEIVEASGGWAELLEVRAYADYRIVPEGLVRNLMANDIDLIHVPSRSGDERSRDAADFRLLNDLLDAALRRADVSKIVLGGGDRAFFPALAKARRIGKAIAVLGVQGSISRDLADLAGPGLVLLTGGRVLVPVGFGKSLARSATNLEPAAATA